MESDSLVRIKRFSTLLHLVRLPKLGQEGFQEMKLTTGVALICLVTAVAGQESSAYAYGVENGSIIARTTAVEKGKAAGTDPGAPVGGVGIGTGSQAVSVIAVSNSPKAANPGTVKFWLNESFSEFSFRGLLPSHTTALAKYPCEVKVSIRFDRDKGAQKVWDPKVITVEGNFSPKGDWEVAFIGGSEEGRHFQPVALIPHPRGPWLPLLWSDGAIHELPEKISFAGYEFQPDKEAPLVFKVVADKGYVFEKGKGRVRTPEGKTITLDDSNKGLVLGEPSKKNP
jgi:hypothetical protein